MATNKTDFFWTDIEQAQERLTGALVVYDGRPVAIQEIVRGEVDKESGARSATPRAIIVELGSPETRSKKILSSAKFNNFRDLPNLGWMNITAFPGVGAVFTMRRTMTQRIHGLVNTNTSVNSFRYDPEVTMSTTSYSLNQIMHDKGFIDAHNGVYPSLDRILSNIAENSSIAYSRSYCVMRDSAGIRWLYRNTNRVGLFTGTDTLLLLTKFAYLREEIMEDAAFTVNNIRDF